MKPLSSDNTLLEVVVAVSEALEHAGIVAPLSGGAAIAIYTNNRYLTKDLDFVTSARAKALTAVLEPLGFTASPDGRHFTHEPSGWLVEFPPGPLAFGNTGLGNIDIPVLETECGQVRVIAPTQSLMDRLAVYFHWNRQRPLRDQARALVQALDPFGRIEWDTLYQGARVRASQARKWTKPAEDHIDRNKGYHSFPCQRLRQRYDHPRKFGSACWARTSDPLINSLTCEIR
ncbi:MAG: hypothetical protein R3E82_11525 [Pseudomonadales bacterium]